MNDMQATAITTNVEAAPSDAFGALEASVHEYTRLLHEAIADHAWQKASTHARVRLDYLQQASKYNEKDLVPRIRALFTFVINDNGMLGPNLASQRAQLQERLLQDRSRSDARKHYERTLSR